MAELHLRDRALSATVAYLGAWPVVRAHLAALREHGGEGALTEREAADGVREATWRAALPGYEACSMSLRLRFGEGASQADAAIGADAALLFVDGSDPADPGHAAARVAVEIESARRGTPLPLLVCLDPGETTSGPGEEALVLGLGLEGRPRASLGAQDAVEALDRGVSVMLREIGSTRGEDDVDPTPLLFAVRTAFHGAVREGLGDLDRSLAGISPRLDELLARTRAVEDRTAGIDRSLVAQVEELQRASAKLTDGERLSQAAGKAAVQSARKVEASLVRAEANLEALAATSSRGEGKLGEIADALRQLTAGLAAIQASVAAADARVAVLERASRVHGETLGHVSARLADLLALLGKVDDRAVEASTRTAETLSRVDKTLRAVAEQSKRAAELEATRGQQITAAIETVMDDLQKKKKGWFG